MADVQCFNNCLAQCRLPRSRSAQRQPRPRYRPMYDLCSENLQKATEEIRMWQMLNESNLQENKKLLARVQSLEAERQITQEKQQLLEQIQTTNTRLAQCQQTEIELKRLHDKCRQDLAHNRELTTAQAEKLRQKTQAYEEQFRQISEQKQKSFQELEDAYRALEKELETEEEEVRPVVAAASELQKDNTYLQHQIADYQKQMAALQYENAQLTTVITQTRQQIFNLTSELQKSQQREGALQGQLTFIQHQKTSSTPRDPRPEELSVPVRSRQEDLLQIGSEKAEKLREKFELSQRDLQRSLTQSQTLEEDKQALNEKVNRLEQEARQSNTQVKSLLEQVQQLQDDLSSTKEEMEFRKRDYNDLKMRNEIRMQVINHFGLEKIVDCLLKSGDNPEVDCFATANVCEFEKAQMQKYETFIQYLRDSLSKGCQDEMTAILAKYLSEMSE